MNIIVQSPLEVNIFLDHAPSLLIIVLGRRLGWGTSDHLISLIF